MKIIIINGPNLNLLGKREVSIYGNNSFEEYLTQLKQKFPVASLEYFQSNHEGELIDRIQQAMAGESGEADGVVINPGGFTHTSVALRDALAGVSLPVVEVHLSNVFAREAFRKESYVSPIALGVISGLGARGYRFALEALAEQLSS